MMKWVVSFVILSEFGRDAGPSRDAVLMETSRGDGVKAPPHDGTPRSCVGRVTAEGPELLPFYYKSVEEAEAKE